MIAGGVFRLRPIEAAELGSWMGTTPISPSCFGGDGTTLRALHVPRHVGSGDGRELAVRLPLGHGPDEMETGLARAFAGEPRVVELPTLDVSIDGVGATAVNDVVCATSQIGRIMSSPGQSAAKTWGFSRATGVICASPTGSTAVQPLERRACARLGPRRDGGHLRLPPHSLHARPLVVPRGLDLVVRNETHTMNAQ